MALPFKKRPEVFEEDARSDLSLYSVRDLVAEFLVNRIEKKCEPNGHIAIESAIGYIDRIKSFNIYHDSIASLLSHKREIFSPIPPEFGTELISELYLFVASHIVTGFGQETLARFCDDIRISAYLAHVSFDEHEHSATARMNDRDKYDEVLRNGAAEWVPMVILLKLTHLEIEEDGLNG